MLTSNQFSYKNPKFFGGLNYNNTYSLLVYEKWDSLNSNIAVRKVYYDSLGSELMITNNTMGQNINPSLSDNILVWQSNISGNWDIYYSLYSSGSWSAPIALVSSAQNETDPFILSNHTSPIQFSFYYLAYIKNNDVYFKSYRVNPSTWYPDTNITANISYNCITPCIGMGDMGGTRKVFFNMVLNDSVKRIYIKTFTENSTTGIVSWDTGNALYQPKTQENLRTLSEKCIYEYDTLGNTHSISLYKDIFTFPLWGKNSGSMGTDFGIITSSPVYWHYTSFACVNKRSDSTALKVTKNLGNYSPPNETNWKSFYLGNADINSRLSVSTAVMHLNYYKIITVCEKILNGKGAFYATFMTDFLNGVNNESEIVNHDIYQNYPNPFNPTTTLKFDISKNGFVKLEIFDILGRAVATLVNEQLTHGSYSVDWNASTFPSGVYFYKLTTDGFSETKKMVLMK